MSSWMVDALADLQRRALYRKRRRVESAQGRLIRIRGQTFVNFASNDYLGLAGDERLARAATRAARQFGCGAGASPLISGHSSPLRRLERALTRWEEKEAALVFPSGFAANIGTVASLVEEGDAVFSDAYNHASLVDGCRLSRARIHVYRHADANHLEDLLRRHGSAARRRLIVTDSLFSMDGDLAPLAELCEAARRHDCLLLVDEAHATGVLGLHGRGAMEHVCASYRLEADRCIHVGTLSKALGAQGGFTCGPRSLIAWLVNRARPYVFSTGLAPPVAAAARRAVAIVADEPERRRRLLRLADSLRRRLREIGFGETSARCQIVPLIVGDSREALRLSRRLEEHGLLVPAIRPPSVPEGTARLRISLTANQEEPDVERLVDALHKCWTKSRGKRHAHG